MATNLNLNLFSYYSADSSEKRFLDMELRYSFFGYKFLYDRSGEQY